MAEAAPIMGIAAAVLLIVAFAALVKLFRGPALQRLDGSTEQNAGHQEIASQLLVFAVGLSALAAIIAAVGWFAS